MNVGSTLTADANYAKSGERAESSLHTLSASAKPFGDSNARTVAMNVRYHPEAVIQQADYLPTYQRILLGPTQVEKCFLAASNDEK